MPSVMRAEQGACQAAGVWGGLVLHAELGAPPPRGLAPGGWQRALCCGPCTARPPSHQCLQCWLWCFWCRDAPGTCASCSHSAVGAEEESWGEPLPGASVPGSLGWRSPDESWLTVVRAAGYACRVPSSFSSCPAWLLLISFNCILSVLSCRSDQIISESPHT